jgi:hypothetical protein
MSGMVRVSLVAFATFAALHVSTSKAWAQG